MNITHINNNEIKIESGVPLPPRRTKNQFKWLSILNVMKSGDSFEMHQYPAALRKIAKESKIELAFRELGKKHYRVWRIA